MTAINDATARSVRVETPFDVAHEDGTRRPRVLFIGINYAPEPTGIAPYTTGMAEGLASQGWEVEVITGYPHYPWWRIPEEHADLPHTTYSSGVRVSRVHHFIPRRHNLLSRALHEITFGLRVALSHWRSTDIVVVASPALLSSSIVAAKARLLRRPVVMWVQDIYTLGVRQAGSGRGGGLIERIERGLANASDRVVVIHDRFRRQFVDQLDVTSPVSVVRNWSHVPDLSRSNDRATRLALGWADDDIIVLHAGNMGAKQGLENVVLAARLASERKSAVRFVLLGDGNTRVQLAAMGEADRLQFIDPLPDDAFHSVLASADILLVNERPGLTEMSVPSKLTTYFATGLPVLAAVDAMSTTHDEVIAAGAGTCIPAGDPEALLAAAEAMAADPAQARAAGESGRRYRQEVLSETAAIDGFATVLRAVVEERVQFATETRENSTAIAVG